MQYLASREQQPLEVKIVFCEPDETEFLIAVVQAVGLTLQDWVVFAGGDGYDSVEVARGTNASSFLDYVQYDKARV